MTAKENLQQSESKMSRREFLRVAALVGAYMAGASLGTGIGWLLTDYDSPSASTLLKEAAADVVRKNEQTSFVPEGKFTGEFFEKVRNGTFAVNVTSDKDGLASGTGWCAHKEGNNVYIVTNRHVVFRQPKTTIEEVQFWRPNIDTQKTVPSKIAVAWYEEFDIAVLKCELSPEQAQEITPLAFQDDAKIERGEKMLVVGFPAEFRNTSTDGINFPVLANIATVENNADKQSKVWRARGLTSNGSSGSPAVIPDEQGNPKVIGIISRKADLFRWKNWRQRKQSIEFGLTLKVNSLIQAVNKG